MTIRYSAHESQNNHAKHDRPLQKVPSSGQNLPPATFKQDGSTAETIITLHVS